MKTAKEIYPSYWEDQQKSGSFYGPGDYQPIIDEIGIVLVQVDDADYQGDTRVMYKKDNKYGYLIFGWGSCSGCDSLQACESIDEIQQLINDLVDKVKWFDSLDEIKSYFLTKDWGLEYSWHAEETKEFIQKVLEFNSDTES